MATNNVWLDLFGLLSTLSLSMPGSKIYVLCDSITKEHIEKSLFPFEIKIFWVVELDAYSNKNRNQMESEGLWATFLLAKTVILKHALDSGEPDTMFLDPDILVLSEISFDEYCGEDVALSPHFIKKSDVALYGFYNAGVFWTKNRSTIDTWIEGFPNSRYFDQACLEEVGEKYSTLHLHEGHNLSWWRIFQGDSSPLQLLSCLGVKEGTITYKNNTIAFIHTHIASPTGTQGNFNKVMINLMRKANLWRHLLVISFIKKGVWEVLIPKQPKQGIWRHTDDSFRELVDMWQELGYCTARHSDQVISPWLYDNHSVLLYDRPTFEWFDVMAHNADKILLGNPNINLLDYNNELQVRATNWIFWARRPKLLQLYSQCVASYVNRSIDVVFIGNIENQVQSRYRSNLAGLEDCVDDLHITMGTNHTFTQTEYLERLANAKFGLCVRGYGAKCHREIELMALGTVPLVMADVDIDGYFRPPQEGVHYFRIRDKSDILNTLQQVAPERWMEMSTACRVWWQENAAPLGSFKTTLEAIFAPDRLEK